MIESNYLGNPNVRGADVEHPWTKEELIFYGMLSLKVNKL